MSNLPLTRKPQVNFDSAQQADRLSSIYSIHYFLDGFLLKQRSQRHSQRTIDFYRDNLQRFIWFLNNQGYPTDLKDITPNHIRHFLIYLNEQSERRWGSDKWNANKPLSPSSVHAYARSLRAFFRWATREARLAFNPFGNVDMPALPNQWKVTVFTDEEIVQLFLACDHMTSPFIAQRNRTMLAILLDSGIRASELLGLQVGDISLNEGAFTVNGKGSKSRTVVIGHVARRELWTYLTRFRLEIETQYQELFISQSRTPLTYNGLKEVFRTLRQISGITRISVRAHICRHTAATLMHRNGMRGATLQEVLGHTKFDTTRRYYLDIAKNDLIAEHALLARSTT